MAAPGNLAIDGADPRIVDADEKHGKDPLPEYETGDVNQSVIKPQMRRIHDSDISFEEYHYYAKQTRLEENNAPKSGYEMSMWSLIFPSKTDQGVKQIALDESHNLTKLEVRKHVSDEEWTNASRALRTATRGAIFYLITTDILGPFALPFAIATTGWGPGIAMYTVFAALAGYSGYLLWDIFMGMDSYQFPVRHFGDLGFRLYGPWLRHLFNFLEAIQLLLNVGLLIISNGEILSQVSKFKLCFAVCCLIWALVGFGVGQIRTLQKFGWLANASVWLNLICMFITMGAAAHFPPNYLGVNQSAGAVIDGGILVTPVNGTYPPVQTSGGMPSSGGFIGAVSGAMNAVFAYGGSMIFPEFMAEMKRPNDFLKAMWAAQAFIYFWYMFYGLFMYGYQGQYVINPTYLGVSEYSIQTAGNMFAMLSAIIAAGLYGNIGIKIVYNNIFIEWFRFPSLETRMGKFLWSGLIPIYWSIAFAVAAGIPNFIGMTSVVAAFCILHFTYTFPPLLSIMYWAKKNALREGDGEGFDPATGMTTRYDTGLARFIRGFFGHRWYLNVLHVLYVLGALTLSALGAYSAIEILIGAFAENKTDSYVCTSPLE